MKKLKNRSLSIVVVLAMVMACFAAFTVTSFAAEGDAVLNVKVVELDGTEATVASYSAADLAQKDQTDFNPYFYFGKGKATVLVAKGVRVSDLISGVDLTNITGLKVTSGDFTPNNNQLAYLTKGVTYLKATVDADNNVVIADETSKDVPFIISTEMYYNGDNGVTLGGETDVQEAYNLIMAKINEGTAKAGANRCAPGSLDTSDIAGNKFVTGPDTIKLYKGEAQKLTVKGSKATLKAKKLKKAKQVVKTPVTVSGQVEGSVVTFEKSKVSKSAKNFTVDSDTGNITVKKGTKKGKYTVTVKATASGDLTHFEASGTAKVVITVK